jgi:hypothetical protein
MLRIFVAFIMAVHGLIHLLGFAKEWRLAAVSQLKGDTLIPLTGGLARVVGLLWLLACLLLLFATLTYLVRKEWWWMIGLVAIVLSQILITLYWQDAKFGSVANLILLLACVLSYAAWTFDGMARKELTALLPATLAEKRTVTMNQITSLPPVVQKWLLRTNIVNKEIAQTMRLYQAGRMRNKPDGSWMPVEAEQYFAYDHPGFIWLADVAMAAGIYMAGRDKYQDGKGHMLIKLLSLVAVVDARGKEIDQGTMLRFLAEIVWAPSTALAAYLTWEEIDATSARVTMTYKDLSASGVFRFDAAGDVTEFEAQRYYYSKEGSTLETWHIHMDETSYQEFQGIRIPTRSSVTWKFKEGDFTWYELEIGEVAYNKLNFMTH